MTHTSTEQPEALRLAHALSGGKLIDDSTEWADILHAAAAELLHLQARNEQLEKSESDLIAERDYRDEIIDRMANAVLGTDRAEWSSSYNFMDAVKEIEDHIAKLEAQLSAIGAGGVEPLRKQAVPHTKVKADFRWDSENQHHIPTLLIEFEPVPAGEPCDAKGWTDRDNLAAMLAAAPQPPAAAPVELPKPVGWFHRHPVECKNGEVWNYQIASGDKKDGWEEFPLYTEQQVRALLAEVSAPAQKSWCDGCSPDNCCGCGPAAPAKVQPESSIGEQP